MALWRLSCRQPCQQVGVRDPPPRWLVRPLRREWADYELLAYPGAPGGPQGAFSHLGRCRCDGPSLSAKSARHATRYSGGRRRCNRSRRVHRPALPDEPGSHPRQCHTPLLVVRHHPPEQAPKGPPVISVTQVGQLVGDHVVDEAHRGLDDAPVHPERAPRVAARPAFGLLSHEDLGLGHPDRSSPRPPRPRKYDTLTSFLADQASATLAVWDGSRHGSGSEATGSSSTSARGGGCRRIDG